MAGDFFHAGWVLKRALQLQPLRKSSIIIHLYCKTTWFFTSKYYTILTVWGMPTNSISRWNYAGCCRAAVTFSLQWGSYDWLDLLDLVRRGRCRLCSCTRSHQRIRLPLAQSELWNSEYTSCYTPIHIQIFLDCAGSLCATENYLAYVRNNFIIFIYNITSI